MNPHGLKVSPPRYHHVIGKKVMTANGKAALNPSILPDIKEQVHRRFQELKKKKVKKNELLMITVRKRRSQNSWIHNCPSMMKNRTGNVAEINTADAERLGLKKGERIRIKNRLAQIELPFKTTEDIRPGVILVPHGWGHHPNAGWRLASANAGVNSNLLCDDQKLEKPSGHPLMNGIPVQVSPVGKHQRKRLH